MKDIAKSSEGCYPVILSDSGFTTFPSLVLTHLVIWDRSLVWFKSHDSLAGEIN